ncbi:MAG TPA: hypothetical protein VFT59_03145 [Candidatus Saccharimonadales bacterium]|nr:hypothetical protein [Candidatus Saccharimonadales bacterium]
MAKELSQDYKALQPFTRLIGDWKLKHRDLNTGKEWGGNDTFAWLPGDRFLTFRHHEDSGIDGLMVIGKEMGWEETEPSSEIIGHWFESSSGYHYKYIWEITGDTVQFWLNSKESGMFFKGTFSEDDNTINGTWKWPGGGYDLIMNGVHDQ